MSFWFFGRKEKGRRNYYSVTILIPAILFFVSLFGADVFFSSSEAGARAGLMVLTMLRINWSRLPCTHFK